MVACHDASCVVLRTLLAIGLQILFEHPTV
jgi:hypothetical protein